MAPMATIRRGFEDAEEGGDQSVDLAFLILCRAPEHHVEFAAGLTAGDQVDDQRREVTALCERFADRGTFANSVRRLLHGVAHRQVRDDLARYLQRLEHRNATAGQNAKRARETRCIEASDDAADDRHAQQIQVPFAPRPRGSSGSD